MSARTCLVWGAAVLGFAVSCASAPPGDAELGAMAINLTGRASSGAVYRLRGAIITVAGQGSDRDWNTEDDPSRTVLSADVAPGAYAATLHAGWRLERIDGGTATPVVGVLVSDNPAMFSVVAAQRTAVPLRFQVDADDVDLTAGYDSSITVDEVPRRLVVAQFGFESVPTSLEVFAAAAHGDVAPLQTITGPATTLGFPFGVTVADHQILLADQGSDALTFYSITATGDVAPARRIVGPTTQLVAPIDVAVSGGEIYTTQANGRILVFPWMASGDVAPTRAFEAPDSHFLAIDRGEIYVSTNVADGSGTFPPRIRVFPTTASGTPSPTRTIVGPIERLPSCLSGIAVHGGEVFVSDNCNPAIRVFPETADGLTMPTRVIQGPAAGLQVPWQVAVSGGEIYVTDQDADRVAVFPVGADGDVAPRRSIKGPTAAIAQPFGVAVF